MATSAMTAFSLSAAKIQNQEFREPEILAKLISRSFPNIPKSKTTLAGWFLHYGVGFLFCSLYDRLWRKTPLKPGLLNGALVGAASGLVGILAWKKTLDIHPAPPHLEIDNYFGHLLLAHVIFGTVAVIPYRKEKLRISTDPSKVSQQKALPGPANEQ